MLILSEAFPRIVGVRSVEVVFNSIESLGELWNENTDIFQS